MAAIMPKIQLEFTDEWLAMAKRALAYVNMLRLQQKQPRISLENWLHDVVTLGLAQTFAEVENATASGASVQVLPGPKGPGRGPTKQKDEANLPE